MTLLKLYGKIKRKVKLRRMVAFLAILAMIVGLMQPASVVRAADDTGDQTQMEKIETFKATLEKGATLENGKYVWSAKTDADDHRFTFRVDYSMSGVKELEPGAIKILIPKTILKDRKGNYADYMDLSIPSEDEYNSASKEDKKNVNYVWKESTDEAHKNCVEITNVTQRTAGENGYFEVAYVTNEQTFEYKDEVKYDADQNKYTINETPQSDPFYADISVTNISDGKPQTVTASTDKIPVYINTTAEIASTNKRCPSKVYREWQSSWGKQPDEAKNKYFLVWEIVSKIKNDPTQPYTFTLEDKPVSKELHLLGYSMGSQGGPFTAKGNQVTGQRSGNDRYDYVLTYYDPDEFTGKDYYELKNSVVATVTPEDKTDASTSANSSKVWEWDTPKFVHPTGHFYGEKYGDSNWDKKFGYYHDYSSYSLDKMQAKNINSIDTFRYYISDFGYPYPWTRNGDADNPSSYGKKKVTYQLSDDELYLEDKITTKDTGGDQLESGIPEGAHRLDSSDYQFLYADWNVSSQFRIYNDEEKKFITDPDGKYSSDDAVHFWVKTNEKDSHDGEYKEVASYDLGSGKASISDSSIVKELTRDRITFKSDKDDPSVTGIRFTTSNAYYCTKIEAYPMVRLKNSDYVMKKLFRDENPKNVTEDNCKSLIRLHNSSDSDVYDSDSKLIYHVKNYAFDRATRSKKESEIYKHVVSAGSNRIKKKYIIRWKITPSETLTTDSGTDYLVQNSGTFYDLLPKGTHLQKGSIDVETENGMLSHSSFSYSVEGDYENSGRDLIKVSVPVQAKYYNLYLNAEMSWDAIHDYGTKINNPVAYETGNDEIYNGYPDDDYVDSSGAVHKLPLSDVNKAYMIKLDPKCTAKRFIYDEEPHDIDTLTAAASGLKKQIKDEHDSSYSYETYTTPEGKYSYRIRFANTMTDKAKNLIFFDSLENYTTPTPDKKESDWHGTLKRFDVSQLKQKGISPVIYVSEEKNLSIDAHHDLTDLSVWQKLTDSTDLSKVCAFAIDCRKASNGNNDFVLNAGESLSAVIYMQAPASVAEKKEGQFEKAYPKAYNNIYIQDTIMSGKASSDFFIHQDYTEIRYHVLADIGIHKQSAENSGKFIEGAKYTLKGTSDYGTEVNEEVITGKQGDAVFEGIEKGTYILKESYSPDDWLLDKTKYTVKVDGTGKITCDGKEADSKKIVLKDSPRIHGDISFMKYSTAGNRPATGAKFRLSGKSKYGMDVMEYAVSDAAGKVKFENIEWGTYKLKEVEAPDGYIPDSTERTAVISDSGIGGIEDAEMLKTGSAVIRNEPYHTVEISKQSSYNSAPLSGAEFRLTGTSNYGTAYDKTATSGENGLAKFTGLEAGTYIIQETKSPKDYYLDSTKHIVKVNKDDTYTIDGLKKNESNYYRMDNSPEEKGKIIVKKKWKDNKKNADRKEPIIHITTDINKVPTYAVWRDNEGPFTGAFNYVDPGYKIKTEKVEYAKNITSADQIPENAVRLDKNYNDENAKCKIWGWLTDDGTMYYWTNAQTTRLTDWSNMLFCDMYNVESIDMSKINTSEVTVMNSMFKGCSSLTSLDVSNFETKNVTNMRDMFGDCSKLKSLDISNFDTSNVTDMYSMFAGCQILTSLDLSNFETKNVTNMSYMFYRCFKLTSPDISNFDTSNVTDMGDMFRDCSELTSLDISNFNTPNVTDMGGMFRDCSKLTSIYVSDRWSTDKVTDSDDMFSRCSKLPNYSSSYTDKTHANYGSDGYLTYKASSTAKANTSSTSFASQFISMILSRLSVPVYAADSASYVSTDEKHCTITKDGDTWTYEFSVADDSTKYYAYEDDVEGYTSSNNASSYGIVTKDEPLTITNTANELPKEPEKPKSASLSLSKAVDGKQLTETDIPVEKYSHTPNIDDTGNANGVYGNNLRTNDVVTIPGASMLHVKLYCSTDDDLDDWLCVWEGSHPDYGPDKNFSNPAGGEEKTSISDIEPIEGDIDGDSITFGFRSNESAGYYGYYAIVTGYDANGNAITHKSKVKSITDKSPIEDIPSSYSDITYMFDITLKNSDSSKLSGAKIFGDTVFTDGKAQVGVKAGEAKTFSDLPGGTTYTITEKKYDDFYTESKNASGTLNAGDNVEAKFTNHYQKPKMPDTPKEYSSFTLKKNVTGFFQNTQNYTFDASFRKLDPNTEYSLSDGTKFTSDADGYGYVQTKLSDKGSVTFTSIPVGAQYRVTEESGDWSSAYRITNSTDKGDIAQSAGSAEKNESLSTEWETADSGEGITVTYTNTVKKYQNLVLKKAVTGGKATDKFRFTAEFKDLYETVSSDAGTIVPDDDGTANVDVYLNAGDEIVFKNVPVTTKYRFTEKANAGKASYTIRTDVPDGVAGGHFEKSADGNTEAMKDLSTSEETVDEGENAIVTFLNDMPKTTSTTSVTLNKQVSGAFADRNKFFKFTVSLTGADKKQSYSFDYTNGSSSHDGTKNAASIATDENGNGTADIWLKHNDTVVIKNIPLSAKYSVAEDPGEYVPGITINGEKADSVSERQAAPDVIVFTNTNTAILPTGITQHKNAVALASTAIIALLISAWYILKKRHKKESKAK